MAVRAGKSYEFASAFGEYEPHYRADERCSPLQLESIDTGTVRDAGPYAYKIRSVAYAVRIHEEKGGVRNPDRTNRKR